MKHTIRRTLLALGAGVVVQRLAQLVAFVLIGRALGAAGLGVFAQGQAMAAMLVMIAGAGVRNRAARALAHDPASARELVLATVRRRLVLGVAATAAGTAIAFATSAAPLFWVLCVLQVVPAAFDLKHLLDATGRARAEVAIDSGIAMLQLLAVLAWCAAGGDSVTVLAAIILGCRCLYAACAIAAIGSLATGPARAPASGSAGAAAAEVAHQLLTVGDVWLVAVALGDAAAGHYAFAGRFAAAALVPSGQLARLLLPHLLRAGAGGDSDRTLVTALRATALVTLPAFAGGAIVASGLCSAAAADFAGAAPALVLLLLAGCLQHLGWQCSHALLAQHRDRAYAHGLGWPSLLHAVALGIAAMLPATTAGAAAANGAWAAVVAQAVYLLGGLTLTCASWRQRARTWLAPLAVTAATGAAAWSASAGGLLLQLLAGGASFAAGLWFAELRGRWRRVGDGLASASGFGA